MPSDNTAPSFLSEMSKDKKRRKIEEKANKRKYERQRKSKISLPVKSSGYISYLYSVKKINVYLKRLDITKHEQLYIHLEILLLQRYSGRFCIFLH